jgi:hypothetical protein
MNGIVKNHIIRFEEFNFLNQDEKIKFLKDFIETLENVDKTGRDIFEDFEEMFSLLKEREFQV